MSVANHTNEDPSRHVWTTTMDESKSYALSGNIMLTAIIILFVVVVFLVILHLYARWYLLRVRRRYLNRRRRNRQHRATHLIFYVDPNNPTMLTVPSCGLDRDVLNSLPVFVYSKKSQVNDQPPLECSVCLSEFEENEEGRKLPKCHHSFHTDCIDMWFESHSTCPLCRSPVEPPSQPVITSNEVVISIPAGTPEPEPSSNSECCPACRHEGGEGGTTSLAGRRKGLEMVVEVPRGNTASDGELRLSSPASSGFRSPGSRLLSLKRILSMNRKGSAVSPSSGVGPSSGSVHCMGTESDIESGRFELTQLQNRANTPR